MASRGRGRAGKGGASKRPQSRHVTVSKALSFLLRHGGQDEGVHMDEGGWADVADVLRWHRLASLHVTFDELSQIVNNSDKQRFALASNPASTIQPYSATIDPSQYRIRASQGHSVSGISNSNIYTKLDPSDPDCPTLVVHGTYPNSWEQIRKTGGLKPMNRTHIHFATNLPKKLPPLDSQFQSKSKSKEDQGDLVISGMRNTCSIVVWVDLKRSAEEGGVQWWRSKNGVILTDGLQVGEGDQKEKVLGLEWIKWVERRDGEVLFGKKDEGAEREFVKKADIAKKLEGLDLKESELIEVKGDGKGEAIKAGIKTAKEGHGTVKGETKATKDSWDD